MDNHGNNKCALFRNDRKAKETQPDYSGTVTIDGVSYWLSGWINEGKDSRKYISLSLRPKEHNARHVDGRL
jgi:hypothetical protein